MSSIRYGTAGAVPIAAAGDIGVRTRARDSSRNTADVCWRTCTPTTANTCVAVFAWPVPRAACPGAARAAASSPRAERSMQSFQGLDAPRPNATLSGDASVSQPPRVSPPGETPAAFWNLAQNGPPCSQAHDLDFVRDFLS